MPACSLYSDWICLVQFHEQFQSPTSGCINHSMARTVLRMQYVCLFVWRNAIESKQSFKWFFFRRTRLWQRAPISPISWEGTYLRGHLMMLHLMASLVLCDWSHLSLGPPPPPPLPQWFLHKIRLNVVYLCHASNKMCQIVSACSGHQVPQSRKGSLGNEKGHLTSQTWWRTWQTWPLQ